MSLENLTTAFDNVLKIIIETLPENSQRDVAIEKLQAARIAAFKSSNIAGVIFDAETVRSFADTLLAFQRDGGRIVF